MEINVKLNLDLWVARDEEGELYIYKHKPKKDLDFWSVYNDCFGEFGSEYTNIESLEILIPHMADYFDFSKVQWKDKKPKQLKDIVRSKNE